MWNEPSPSDLAKIPKPYSTEKIPLMEKMIYGHFFIGESDWYVAEYNPADRVYFGYAILNQDYQNAEWGYFAHDELAAIRVGGIEVDRDLHWTPTKAGSIEDILRGNGL